MTSIAKHQRTSAPEARRKPPANVKKRERIFKLVLVAFPIAFLIVLEILLRVFHYGGNLDLFIEKNVDGKKFYAINKMVGRRYFIRKNVTPMTSEDVFDIRKSPDAYRIFCLGGSSTFGYPYMYNGSFPSLLKDRLTALLPNKIEMVNVGMPAVNSYTVLDFVREIMDYRPDLLIVYMGHNEFYGALGVGSTESLGRSRTFIQWYLKLRKLRLFLLVRDAVVMLRELFVSDERPPQEATLMEMMVKEKYIGLNSEEYKIARDAFRENLSDIIEIAQRHHVGILISNLVSNLRDQPPFISLFSDSISENQRARWQNIFNEGVKLEESAQFEAALKKYQEAKTIDGYPAKLHYRIAKCYDALRDTIIARKEYTLAKDLDGLRFRTSSEFNTIIYDICQQKNVPFVDMEEAFARQSPDGIIGKELMLEHLHPNFDGYFLMAKEFCRAMMEHGFIAPKVGTWHAMSLLDKTDDEYRQIAGVTELDYAAANIRMKILTSAWPFTESKQRIAYQPKDIVEQTALDYCRHKITWEQALVKLGEYYVANKSYDKAAAEYWALKKATPYNISPYLILGDIYLEQEKYDRAESILLEALQVENNPIAHERLGMLYLRRELPHKALQHLQEAIAVDLRAPRESQLWRRYCLGVAYVQIGNISAARDELSKVLALDPNYELARGLIQQLQSVR